MSQSIPYQMKMHFENLPSSMDPDEESPELKLFVELGEAGVLIATGALFAADPVDSPEEGRGHYRIAFSNASVSVLPISCSCTYLTR